MIDSWTDPLFSEVPLDQGSLAVVVRQVGGLASLESFPYEGMGDRVRTPDSAPCEGPVRGSVSC